MLMWHKLCSATCRNKSRPALNARAWQEHSWFQTSELMNERHDRSDHLQYPASNPRRGDDRDKSYRLPRKCWSGSESSGEPGPQPHWAIDNVPICVGIPTRPKRHASREGGPSRLGRAAAIGIADGSTLVADAAGQSPGSFRLPAGEAIRLGQLARSAAARPWRLLALAKRQGWSARWRWRSGPAAGARSDRLPCCCHWPFRLIKSVCVRQPAFP